MTWYDVHSLDVDMLDILGAVTGNPELCFVLAIRKKGCEWIWRGGYRIYIRGPSLPITTRYT